MGEHQKQLSCTRTIKLKLFPVGNDKKAIWAKLRSLSNETWKAANWIASGQYLNDLLLRRIYARRKIDPAVDKDAVQAIEEEFTKFFGTKRQATTERDIKEAFPALPPSLTNVLNQTVVSNYRKEKREILSGNRSLRAYRKGVPMPVTGQSIQIVQDHDRHHVIWTPRRGERLEFEVSYGRDRANNYLTMQRVIDGVISMGSASIQLRDGELFLLVPVKEPIAQHQFVEDLAIGVDLGLAVPAYVALSKGFERRAIGSRDDFLKARMQLQSRHRRLQKAVACAHGGHGRSRKLKAMLRLRNAERCFVRTYNHFISKSIIDFAIRNAAGTVKLECLEGFAQDQKNQFILRNWSYFELQNLIEEKAKRAGMKVIYVDPYHTSQTCSQCGHYEAGQRLSQSEFRCKKCAIELNADYNAALNIAKSTATVNGKEDCQAWKNNQPQTA